MRPSRKIWLPRRTEIKVKLARANLGVNDLARELGMSVSHTSDVINGRRTSDSMAQRIADYFEVPIEDLFEIKDLGSPGQASAA